MEKLKEWGTRPEDERKKILVDLMAGKVESRGMLQQLDPGELEAISYQFAQIIQAVHNQVYDKIKAEPGASDQQVSEKFRSLKPFEMDDQLHDSPFHEGLEILSPALSIS